MATRKKADTKKERSAAEVKRIADQVEAEIAQQRQKLEKRGQTFVGLNREEIDAKLRRVNSPFISSESWNNTAPPGGSINYTVGVFNPDPFGWSNLAVAVAIGNRNPIVSNDVFLTEYDARFATLAQPFTLGFSLAPGASTSFNFTVRIPAGIEKTGYFGNTVLQQLSFLDVGKVLDRACFFFGVV